MILDVLIRKHKSIKSDLGVAVAVPGSGEQIAEALFEGALFREQAGAGRHQLALDFIDDLDAQTRTIHAGWENARDREKASRSRFAQHTLKPEAVAAELEQVRAAIGRSEDVARFFTAVLRAANVPVRADAIDGKTGGKIGTADKTGTSGKTVAKTSAGARSRTRAHAAAGAADAVGADSPADTDRAADAAGAVGANDAADTASAAGTDRAADAADPARHGRPNHDEPDRGKPGHGRITVQVSLETPRALRQAIGQEEPFTGRFDLPLPEGEIHLGRTSPVVEGLASWTLDQALDPESRDARPVASRCGAIATSAVSERTTLLVARFRYHLVRRRSGAGGRGPGGGDGSTASGPGPGGGDGSTASDPGPGGGGGGTASVPGSDGSTEPGAGGGDTILCEEIVPLACTGPAEAPHWLSSEEGERLLVAEPERNLLPTAVEQQLDLLLPALPVFQAALASVANERAEAQRAAHERVRAASRARAARGASRSRIAVEPVLPVDVLGAWVLLPVLPPARP